MARTLTGKRLNTSEQLFNAVGPLAIKRQPKFRRFNSLKIPVAPLARHLLSFRGYGN